MKCFLLVCLMLLGSLATAQAFTCDPAANTCTYRITITEPSKTQAGLPLTNYKQTNIKTSVNGGAFATLAVPATSPTGGGTVFRDITFATAPCAKTTLDVKSSGVNTLNTEGVEATAVGSPVTVDRTVDPSCAPAAPSLRID